MKSGARTIGLLRDGAQFPLPTVSGSGNARQIHQIVTPPAPGQTQEDTLYWRVGVDPLETLGSANSSTLADTFTVSVTGTLYIRRYAKDNDGNFSWSNLVIAP